MLLRTSCEIVRAPCNSRANFGFRFRFRVYSPIRLTCDLCRIKYGTRAIDMINVLLTCANCTMAVANRAILNHTYNVICGARPCPLRIQHEGKIATSRKVCCSCSKSVAAVHRLLAGSNFAKMVLLYPNKSYEISRFWHAEIPYFSTWKTSAHLLSTCQARCLSTGNQG